MSDLILMQKNKQSTATVHKVYRVIVIVILNIKVCINSLYSVF